MARIDDATNVDLSGYWNDTDARLTTEEMVRDAASRPWLEEFTTGNSRRPVVLFDEVENRTAEHIEQGAFLNSIQRELLNTGRIDFVARPFDRDRLRQERADQSERAASSSRKPLDQELGADFLLGGSIIYVEDAGGGTQLRVYQVDLQLLSLRDNRIVWSGQKRIRKTVGRERVKP